MDNDVYYYKLQYRQLDQDLWQTMPDTTNLTQTVTDLKDHTLYEFTVAAKYAGGPWCSPSERLLVKTKETQLCKCQCVNVSVCKCVNVSMCQCVNVSV